MPALRVGQFDLPTEVARFDLDVAFEEEAGGLKCAIIYNTDLFDAEIIQLMASHLQQLFNDMISDPQQRLTELPSLAEVASMMPTRS